MKAGQVGVFLLGVGLGVLVVSLFILSPLFETILWKTFCNLVKIVPVIVLQILVVVGIVLVGVGFLLKRRV